MRDIHVWGQVVQFSMGEDTRVTADIDARSVAAAESIFRSLGISTQEAIRIFFRQVALHRGLPFAVNLPPSEPQTGTEPVAPIQSTATKPSILQEIDL